MYIGMCMCCHQNHRILLRLATELQSRHEQTNQLSLVQALGTYYCTVRTRIGRFIKSQQDDWKKTGQLARFHGRRDKVAGSAQLHAMISYRVSVLARSRFRLDLAARYVL
jgi:hypothetical protein